MAYNLSSMRGTGKPAPQTPKGKHPSVEDCTAHLALPRVQHRRRITYYRDASNIANGNATDHIAV